MSQHARDLVIRLENALAAGNIAAVDDFYAADVIDHSPFPGQAPGIEGMREKFATLHTAIPDMETTVDIILAEGDLVAERWTSRGTHTGEFLGIAATGRPVVVTGNSIVRVVDGRVVEEWTEFDGLGMMQQLGVG